MDIVKLTPAYKSYIWGGDTLKKSYGKDSPLYPLAESWELSFHKDGESRLPDGSTLASVVSPKDIGSNASDFPCFPTLIKFIDAEQDLSVQVHPSDEYALKHENSFGKTEMWYIVSADEGAGIYLGFSKDVSAEEFENAVGANTLVKLMNFYPVKAGETYFIPAGTIHAIGKGCVILEIQQNSNLTYRVYDWDRKDTFGKARELHINKAKKVLNFQKFEHRSLNIASDDREIIALSRYFQVTRITVNGSIKLTCDKNSFRALSCVSGSCMIAEKKMLTGDTYFIPADSGNFTLSGEATIIMTEVRKYYVGIDLGGSFIKGGIVDDLGNILVSAKIPTESDKGCERVAENIAVLTGKLISDAGLTPDSLEGIGIGVPGMINSNAGTVTYSNNLRWKDFNIAEKVSNLTGLRVKISNDANVAALGELKFGGGKNYSDIVMITLGTGVGGGAVIDGKIFEGNEGAGAEFGHSCISMGGELCTCGRRGCLEAYASATALIRETKKAMTAHPDSKMWEIADTLDKVDGQTAFALKDKDVYANEVVERYIEALATGLTNIASVFRPEAILIGGGISAEGDKLILPLQSYVDENIFGKDMGPQVKISAATLGNKAGLVGAAALLME